MPVATEAHHRRIAEMTYASVHPCYLTKIEKKGRTHAELQEVLTWLTGYTEADIASHISRKTTFVKFFDEANLNPRAERVTGVICGYRIEELDNELTRKVRVLDKIVDELAKGWAMEKILR
jgi:hypothetical protein